MSEDPEIPLNMDQVWTLFESYYPNGDFKTLFFKANEEKVKILQQDTSTNMNMTCHKMLDKSSFEIGRKKKKVDGKRQKLAKSVEPKPAQSRQAQITDMLPKKKTTQPTVSSGKKEESESSEWSDSGDSSGPEDIDEKLKNFIQAGFFA